MNDVNPEQKMAAIKTFAIIGFITAIAFGVWAAVQIVRFAPSAWTSLASLAEIVYNKEIPLSISSENEVVNSGESFRVTWNDVRKEGAYTFTYPCTEGVAATVLNIDGEVVDVTCDSPTPLSGTERYTDVTFTSEKNRFVDIPFTIRFTAAGDATESQEHDGSITVVNATFPEEGTGIAIGEDSDEDGEDIPGKEGTVPAVKPVDEKPVIEIPKTEEKPVVKPTPTPAPTPAPKPVVSPKPPAVTYVTGPVSNPNGNTDLSVTFLGIGTYSENSKVFTSKATLDNDDRGALRFSVENKGTKTSGSWTYRITLPGDNEVSYVSVLQAPLLPTERATIMIAFDTDENDTGTEPMKVEVRTDSDSNSKKNNILNWTVKVVN